MKFFYLSVIAAALSALSCNKKNTAVVQPEAAFKIGADTSLGMVVIGTYDAISFSNQSTDADSIIWNFGNGIVSNSGGGVTTSFDSAGVYNVTLTAFNKSGLKSIASQKIKVVERYLKSFSINNVNINRFSPSQNGLPVFSKLNMWLGIKFSQSATDSFTTNGDISVAPYFQSPIFANIDSSFHGNLTYTVPTAVVLKSPINNFSYPAKGRGFIINLYGSDNTGTYLLASSSWSGVGISVLNGGNPQYATNFALQTYVAGAPITIVLNGAFQ